MLRLNGDLPWKDVKKTHVEVEQVQVLGFMMILPRIFRGQGEGDVCNLPLKWSFGCSSKYILSSNYSIPHTSNCYTLVGLEELSFRGES